ncbi:creatininase [Roseobacter denitrificans]|uniref:Creatinine amidohydrolase n=1 Tax=Roseobacter denitrificans (strain ATCC 33942 / OCh 114) TaxID=375451 RepID=Q16CQ1_ROSDO|nr:creatininase family protein [Roseobacter denitrificans]ABG30242.1 creatinine amidohydrolase [Roseobacter denitrificans OCh 114]AVL53425.1 creatininase [Roseobacter denitrificans]SFF70896.1 creatinine amidohydrolase [Roseobacter denitrificans OCh 114]
MVGVIYWEDLRAPDFKSLPERAIAVLPMGASEQHGPHLAVSVDSDLVEAVLARTQVADGCTVLVLPTLRVTKSAEHDRHPGTLSLTGDTLLAVLRDIAASVHRAGIDRLCLFNGHGGNTALLEVAVRDMRITHDMIAVHCGWFGFAQAQAHFDAQALAMDVHGGDIETSAMLAAAPEKVDMAKARDFRPAMQDWPQKWIGLTGQVARPGWLIDDLNADGACGNAAAATVEKGEALLSSAARNFSDFLGELAAFDHRASL